MASAESLIWPALLGLIGVVFVIAFLTLRAQAKVERHMEHLVRVARDTEHAVGTCMKQLQSIRDGLTAVGEGPWTETPSLPGSADPPQVVVAYASEPPPRPKRARSRRGGAPALPVEPGPAFDFGGLAMSEISVADAPAAPGASGAVLGDVGTSLPKASKSPAPTPAEDATGVPHPEAGSGQPRAGNSRREMRAQARERRVQILTEIKSPDTSSEALVNLYRELRQLNREHRAWDERSEPPRGRRP